GLVFIDLRDREGLTQLVFDAEDAPAELVAIADKLRGEDVIRAEGVVRKRDGGPNPKLATGEVEVVVRKIEMLSKAENLPFRPTDIDSLPGEEIRLRHRHIDLRRPKMQKNLRTRSKVCQVMRRHLDERGFYEVETPVLFKTTPEGARDFLVPSRLQPGTFYALPQSPQILKQILMVSGMDKYFQIVKCFRDEDLRADRQPEFTQLDIEMSFAGQEDVIALISGLLREIWGEVLGVEVGEIARMSYQESMDRFGIDRPDTRFGLEIEDISDIAKKTDFKVFRGAVDAGGVVRAIRVPGGAATLTRKLTDGYAEFVKQFGAGGLPVVKVENGALTTGIAKFLEPVAEELKKRLGLRDGDVVLFGADTWEVVCKALGEVRLKVANDLKMIPAWGEQWNFLWVVDFPMVAWNAEEKRWDSLHHPFTAPRPEDVGLIES
ncbi:MAG: aspartate--tRNA ligase, partial [Planctomycetota bacterium]|nr:aspartate--tRNA ligase [Planctomycetota bacterium]